MFVRPSANVPWKREAMLDSKTLRQLASEVVTKRLPCAAFNRK
jgi:hypothetical protein